MKIEKRNNHKRKIIIGGMVGLSVLAVGILATSYSKYCVTDSIKLGEGIINYSSADFELIGMYLINEDKTETKIDVVPGTGYVLNEEKTKCTVNDTEKNVSIEYKDNKLYFGDITEKGTKCKVYFEKEEIPSASETIIGNVTVKPGTDSFTKGATTVEESGLFSIEDDDGVTYYYRGILSDSTINNWVDFAGFKWRIIRINGDGSIRMIYNGTNYSQTGTGTQIGTKEFNSSSNNNMYVGFRYTNNQVHGTGTPSTILGADNSTDTTTLNGWYNTNIKETKYEKYIDKNAGFCNDRTPSTSETSSNGQGGTETTRTYYGAYIRTYSGGTWKSTQNATLKCNESDLFTTTVATKGNKSLTNPIGLITVDEVLYGGGFIGTQNSLYWLYTNQQYWTMSPFDMWSNYARVYGVYDTGNIGRVAGDGVWGAEYIRGVRPVINLRSDIELTGNGTTTNPYRIAE